MGWCPGTLRVVWRWTNLPSVWYFQELIKRRKGADTQSQAQPFAILNGISHADAI